MSGFANGQADGKWSPGWGLAVGLCLAVAVVFSLCFLRLCVLHPFKVPTGGMRPTIRGQEALEDGTRTVGDHIFVSPLIYMMEEPRRGDIVVFRTSGIDFFEGRADTYFVQRIAAIPGDVVSIRPPALAINGAVLREPEFFDWMARQTNGYEGFVLPPPGRPGDPPLMMTTNGTMKLEADEYLVLGDNSKNSLDGRYFGPIRRKAIVGKVTWIYFPLDRMGPVK